MPDFYGFKEKQIAETLKQSATAQTTRFGLPGWTPPTRLGTVRFTNKSGTTIPPFGLAFIKPAGSDFEDGTGGLIVDAYKWSQITDNPGWFIVNNHLEVESNKEGVSQPFGEYYQISFASAVQPGESSRVGVDFAMGPADIGNGPVFMFMSQLAGLPDVGFYRYSTETTSFFETDGTGIPAASNKYIPAFASCERLKYNQQNGVIEPHSPPKYEQVGNHTGSAVTGNLVIQANKIDGEWFIHVEPCTAPPG